MRKNLRGYLAFAILGGFLSYVIFSKGDINVDIEAYQTQINLLQQKVDSIQTLNIALANEADSLEVQIASYDSKIDNLNTQINVIKKETKIKLDAVDLFGDDELEKFFAERYRQYSDSTN